MAGVMEDTSWVHDHMSEFGKRLSVVRLGGDEQFLIGTQVASLLQRETFNMYRSMKIKRLDIRRASPQQVEYLTRTGAVKAGTHSVTLIPYEDGLYFIADAWYRQHRFQIPYMKKKRSRVVSFLADKPKLHRRKPHPWNVHRAIKASELGECGFPEKALEVSQHPLSPSSDASAKQILFNWPECPDDLPSFGTVSADSGFRFGGERAQAATLASEC